ncbi:hypothetical protein [Emticicia sp. 17c]
MKSSFAIAGYIAHNAKDSVLWQEVFFYPLHRKGGHKSQNQKSG